MNKKYLPSRMFVVSVAVIAAGVLVIFGIVKLTTFVKNKIANREPTKILVKDLVQKDTNSNGIPDWEESLWGLDPTTNGPSNKEFILAKRAALAKDSNPQALPDSATSAENEALSQEFFAVVMSLEQTGNLDDTALQQISTAIGKKIVADPIADTYTKDMASVVDADPLATIQYYTAYINLNNKYKGKNLGDELSFVATALKNNDQGALLLVADIGSSYTSFAKELMQVPVPTNLLANHVDMANNYIKVAKSIDGLSQLLSNPITGMRALVNYKKYRDALADNIQYLSDNFK